MEKARAQLATHHDLPQRSARLHGEYSSVDRAGIIRHMVGRDINELFPKWTSPRGRRTRSSRLGDGNRFRNISFQLHRAKVLGLADWWARGRTETARAPYSDWSLQLAGKCW